MHYFCFNQKHIVKSKFKSTFSLTFFKVVPSTLLLFIILLSCENSLKNTSANTIKSISKEEKVEQKLNITYHFDSIPNDSSLKVFKNKYTIVEQKIIAATNRIDPTRFRTKTKLVVPDTLLSNFIEYSPFPITLNIPDSVTKFILINQRIQLFAAYENGKLAQFGPVSTGRKKKPTPNGLFYTNYKSKKKRSTVDGDWIMPWYFNIANKDGIGMHQFLLPGYPASHSCIRMYEENAKWIYDWANQWKISEDGNTILKKGTPVFIFGIYNFDQIPDWKKLPENPNAINLTEQELAEIKDALSNIE